MNGNTHFDAAAMERPQLVTEETANESYVAEEGITDETMQFSALNRIAEATLALAYEQRTANLIAWASGSADDEGLRKLNLQIAARLGLGGTK